MTGAAAPHPIADLSDSLLGWASRTEVELQTRLSAPWFFEANIPSDELDLLERFYGIFLNRQITAGADPRELLLMTPRLASATLCSRGARTVDGGAFVAEYIAGLGIHGTAAEALGDCLSTEGFIRSLLDAAELQAGAPESDTSDAALCALHAGLNNPEVVSILAALDAHDADVDAALGALTQGAEDTAEEDEAHAALEYDFSSPLTLRAAATHRDVITQLITAVATVRAFTIDEPRWSDQIPDLVNQGVPVAVVESTTAELKERPAGTTYRHVAVGTATRERTPRLILDTRRRKVCLRLPEQPLEHPDAEIAWRIRVGDNTRVYRTSKPWGEVNALSEALDVAIEHQAREITVTASMTDTQWIVPCVDAADPVLIFTPKGQNITDKRSVHYGHVWVVCPTDSSIHDVVSGQELSIEDTFQPAGWDGWSAYLVSTEQADSLTITQAGDTPSITTHIRAVDPRQRVIFRDPSDPVPCLRSTTRLPVFGASLVAEFPPTVSGDTETWYMTISSFAGADNSGEEVSPPEPLEIPAEGGEFEVFDSTLYDAPWVGEYHVRIRGPRNESFRHEFAIIEGIDSTFDVSGACSSFRIPSIEGLSAAQLSVRAGEKPFDISPSRIISVEPTAPGAEFVVSTEEGDAMPVWFKPPRLRFDIPMITQPSMWRTTRMVAQSRSFDPDGVLRVRVTKLPGVLVDPKASVRNQHGTPLRTVKLTAEDEVTYCVPMRALAQAMSGMVSGRLDLEWTDKRSDRRVSVNLAEISTVPDAKGAELSDGSIIFDDVAERALGAWVWPLTAPWCPGVTIEVRDGKAPLPESFVDAGPLAVQLFSADKFNTLRAPLTPGVDSFEVTQPGFFKAQPEDFAQLSAFFAGESESVPSSERIVPLLWEYVSELGSAPVMARTAEAAREALAAHPRQALGGLSQSLVPAELKPRQLISATLVNKLFDAEQAADGVHRVPWIAALEKLADLNTVLVGAQGAEGPVDPDPVLVRSLRSELEQEFGHRLVETLATGRDATLEAACIDASTVAIAHMAPAQQQALLDMFFSQAQIVPGPIMEDSARLLAVFEAFNRREELGSLLEDREAIKSAVSLLKGLKGAQRALYGAARVRFDKLDGVDTENSDNLWALVPVISIVFALAARMQAHGLMGKSKVLASAAPAWAAMAELVPDLVTGDLVAAEAMVIATKFPGLAG